MSANPRIVKEAESLVENNYEVTVVAADVNERLRELDRAVLETAKWHYVGVRRPSIPIYALATAKQRLYRVLIRNRITRSLAVSICAHHRLTRRLAGAAIAVPARLYIAHNLAALPAAFLASKLHRVPFAFDAEDFHTEELTHAQRDPGDQIARELIERHLLSLCAYRTAASPMIAMEYAQKYHVEMTPILNVFPRSEAPKFAHVEPPVVNEVYWFSQTIGRGRGLEQVIDFLALMDLPPPLVLRGNVSAGYDDELRSRAKDVGLTSEIRFLSPAPPKEMARLSGQYALGLAVEPGSSPNNAAALSNKIFTYLLAGIPVLLSGTRAQAGIADSLGEACILVDLHDKVKTARVVETFLRDKERQRLARRHAWALGQNQFNWDIEKQQFLEHVSATINNIPVLVAE